MHQEDSIQVDFIRFAYDVEKAACAIEGSVLPDDYAEMLRQGIWVCKVELKEKGKGSYQDK